MAEPTPLTEFMPGDVIRAEVEIETPANLDTLGAWFESDDDPDIVIELESRPDAYVLRTRGGETRMVEVMGRVGAEVPPGTYSPYRVWARTYGGRIARFSRERLEAVGAWRVRVVPEPVDLPPPTGFELTA